MPRLQCNTSTGEDRTLVVLSAMQTTKISNRVLQCVRCPNCRSKLHTGATAWVCVANECRTEHPIVDGIPVLINESRSVFSFADFTSRRITTLNHRKGALKWIDENLLPSISVNYSAKANYDELVKLLLASSSNPLVLVVGGSAAGAGMMPLLKNKKIELLETDVSLGPRTTLVADAHDLPLANEVVDGVVVQAVLEHVVDPTRCVEEIHRVLKPGGFIYAETPFIQQVHLPPYDFTRFTRWGHRRLFRWFEEVGSGATGGPGMALAWSYQYFLLSFVEKKALRRAVTVFARLTSFYLKYFDRYLSQRSAALDAASGLFFLGRKAIVPISDRKLIMQYRPPVEPRAKG